MTLRYIYYRHTVRVAATGMFLCVGGNLEGIIILAIIRAKRRDREATVCEGETDGEMYLRGKGTYSIVRKYVNSCSSIPYVVFNNVENFQEWFWSGSDP